MTRIYNSKKGFTLVEITTTIAIILTLLAVTTIGISDHINNTKKASQLVIRNYSQLDELDAEVFDTQQQSFTAAKVVPEAVDNSPAQSGSTSGLAGVISTINDVTNIDPVTTAIEDEAADITDEQRAENEAVAEKTSEIMSELLSHPNFNVIPGAESVVEELARAEVKALDKYREYIAERNLGTDTALFLTYCPATQEIALANGDGSWMECWNGQNFERAYLAELNIDGSRTTGRYYREYTNNSSAVKDYLAGNETLQNSNVRFQIDEDFLTTESNAYRVTSTSRGKDTSNVIYLGVKGDQVVPCVCIDVNGNLNTINTFRYTTAQFNTYVNFVQGGTGHMLDTTTFDSYCQATGQAYDTSVDANGNSTSAADKHNIALWKNYIKYLRGGGV
ncbi:MAG: prepilin-type N-terminal cleavage/methylation domain-containing protein [Saccharofermentans sp.]|nr:prepilin-type N-terminal cleavage/methylation domain-containing protein [Saccharofermentans sp.]